MSDLIPNGSLVDVGGKMRPPANHASSTTLAGTVTLTKRHPDSVRFDPGGADRTVALPHASTRLCYTIYNDASDWGEELAVVASDGSTHVAIVPKDGWVKVQGDGSNWVVEERSGSPWYVQTAAGSALTNTTTETALSTWTIPAQALEAGSVWRVRAQGIATATNSTDTLQVRLELDGNQVADTGAVDVADNDVYVIDALITNRSAGATGKCVAMAQQVLDAEGTAVTSGFLAETTIDTTSGLVLAVTGEWSVAATSNSCRSDIFVVERVA